MKCKKCPIFNTCHKKENMIFTNEIDKTRKKLIKVRICPLEVAMYKIIQAHKHYKQQQEKMIKEAAKRQGNPNFMIKNIKVENTPNAIKGKTHHYRKANKTINEAINNEMLEKAKKDEQA